MAIFDTAGYFSSFSFPYWQYLCGFQASFTINQRSMIDRMLYIKSTKYLGNLPVSLVYFHKKKSRDVCSCVGRLRLASISRWPNTRQILNTFNISTINIRKLVLHSIRFTPVNSVQASGANNKRWDLFIPNFVSSWLSTIPAGLSSPYFGPNTLGISNICLNLNSLVLQYVAWEYGIAPVENRNLTELLHALLRSFPLLISVMISHYITWWDVWSM